MFACRIAVLTVGVIALHAASAAPQVPRRPGSGGLIGGPYLLMAPTVQDELKLTDAQKRMLREALRGAFERHRDELAALRDAPDRERMTSRRALARTLNGEVKKGMDFTPVQVDRFDQICLQQRGLEAFADPDVQNKLALTPEQKRRIIDISLEARDRLQELTKKGENNRRETLRKLGDLRREEVGKALAVLGDGQKKAWAEMTGAPVEFPLRRPGVD